jgi:uncharacterized protein
MSQDLAARVAAFCRDLRDAHGFTIGAAETRDALRVLEMLGVRERATVRAGMRAVCCSKVDEIEPFDDAFEAFFTSAAQGAPQPKLAEAGATEESAPPRLHPEPDEASIADAWMAMYARYSPIDGAAEAPSVARDGMDEALTQARRLIARVKLGRSRRWRPQPHGERFDLRRTLRAGLRSGGDLITLHRLGHPRRNPRFVLLVDGSRSMTEYGGPILQFAAAMCRRSRRARAFLFSTRLREVTRELRDAGVGGESRLADLGEAWGGGTRIGASLTQFVRACGAGMTDQTYAMIFSDGFDVGDTDRVARAMREIARRCATVVWVNPHAGLPGFAPDARGMKAALPYIDRLVSVEELRSLA